MAGQEMLRQKRFREQRDVGMPGCERRSALQILVVQECHMMRKDDHPVAAKIVEDAEPELVVSGMAIADVGAAMHQNGAAADLRQHPFALVALRRALIGDGQPQLLEQSFFAEPCCVIAAICGIGESDHCDAPVARNERREDIA